MTLDKDAEQMLRAAMDRSRKTFKETLNAAVRNGLTDKAIPTKGKKFVIHARPLVLRSGIAPASFNKLAGELEADDFLKRNSSAKRK